MTGTRPARREVVVLGSPGGSRVGRHMFRQFVGELEMHRHEVVVVDEGLTSGRDWSLLDHTRVIALALPEVSEESILDRFADQLRRDLTDPCLVFSGREDLQELVSEVSRRWGLRHNPVAVARIVQEKDRCREALRSAGFSQPRVALVHTEEEFGAFLDSAPGSCVVKPRSGTGSTDVLRVDSRLEAGQVFARMRSHLPFVVEEFVDGPEYSIEGVFLSGEPCVVAVTEKETTPSPVFVEIAHLQPPRLAADVIRELVDETSRALMALGAQVGLFHVEVWRTGSGIVLGEVHLRPGGDWIHLLLALTRPDLPVFAALVADAEGIEPPDVASSPAPTAAAARFLLLQPGVVRSCEEVGRSAADPHVVHKELFVGIGTTVLPLQDSDGRSGVVVVRARDVEEADRRARSEIAQMMATTRTESEPMSPVEKSPS